MDVAGDPKLNFINFEFRISHYFGTHPTEVKFRISLLIRVCTVVLPAAAGAGAVGGRRAGAMDPKNEVGGGPFCAFGFWGFWARKPKPVHRVWFFGVLGFWPKIPKCLMA